MQEKNRHNLDRDPEPIQVELSEDATDLLERRKLIKAAIAAVPVVLTITAGQARAQDTGSVIDSQAASPAGDEAEEDSLSEDESVEGDIPAEDASEFTEEELQILNEGAQGIEGVEGLE